jgi:hypothetical protein
MANAHGVLLVFAFVLFVLAALGVPRPDPPTRYNLVAAGLACWVGSLFLV